MRSKTCHGICSDLRFLLFRVCDEKEKNLRNLGKDHERG
jgi:hypothetical protein